MKGHLHGNNGTRPHEELRRRRKSQRIKHFTAQWRRLFPVSLATKNFLNSQLSDGNLGRKLRVRDERAPAGNIWAEASHFIVGVFASATRHRDSKYLTDFLRLLPVAASFVRLFIRLRLKKSIVLIDGATGALMCKSYLHCRPLIRIHQ